MNRQKPKARAADLAQQLKTAIRSGQYAAGQRLVEADLCRTFDASRSHVRDAIRRLEAEGLLVVRPNRGASVRALTRSDVERLYQIREVMEGLAARLVAEATDAQGVRARLIAMRDNLKSAEEAGSIGRYMQENERFHTLLLDLSGNPYIPSILDQIMLPAFRIQFYMIMDRTVIAQSNRQHDAILDAILARDADSAERLMRAHIRDSQRIIRAMPDDCFPEG